VLEHGAAGRTRAQLRKRFRRAQLARDKDSLTKLNKAQEIMRRKKVRAPRCGPLVARRGRKMNVGGAQMNPDAFVWVAVHDAGERDYYYHNSRTNEVTWDRPTDYVMPATDEELRVRPGWSLRSCCRLSLSMWAHRVRAAGCYLNRGLLQAAVRQAQGCARLDRHAATAQRWNPRQRAASRRLLGVLMCRCWIDCVGDD
jgi:hypothetical protein